MRLLLGRELLIRRHLEAVALQKLTMERLGIAETWKLLWKTFGDGGEAPPPDENCTSLDCYKCPDFNPYLDGQKEGEDDLWRLENLTMPACHFVRCGIYAISFRNTLLADSSFCWNDFGSVDFTDADLSRCDMRCSLFDHVQFVRACLSGADLRMSTFKVCDFTDADMTGAKMRRSQAKGLSLSEEQKQRIDWKRREGKVPPGG